jgi:hypothetical protein
MESRTSRVRVACHLGCIVLAVVSCGEPVGPDARSISLSPASPTQLTGTAGTPVADPPSVMVRDARGKAVTGVAVTFSVRSGGGFIQTPRVESNSAGLARVAEWTLGTATGVNAIAATSVSGATVVFTADAVAGAPSQLEKVYGDGQVASPGVALGAHPQVRVTDAYGNRVAGVTVTFVVEAGGGSVSAPVAVSDLAGIAKSGAWVLGPPGVQRMVARAGQLASEPFTARAVTPPFGCAPSDALLTQANVQFELTALSCKGTDGRSLDPYTVVVTKPGAYVFTLTSAEFDTDLELRGAGLVELARNDYGRPTTKSEIKVLLPQGTYTLVVSSSKLGAGVRYNLAYRLASSDVESCEEAFIVRGFTTRGVVYSSDCIVSPNEFADRFRIYLEAGSQVEIRVEDYSYSGPNVRLVSPDGSIADAGPSGDYLTTLGYVAPVNGYYTVLVGLLNESGVQYEITVR